MSPIEWPPGWPPPVGTLVICETGTIASWTAEVRGAVDDAAVVVRYTSPGRCAKYKLIDRIEVVAWEGRIRIATKAEHDRLRRKIVSFLREKGDL